MRWLCIAILGGCFEESYRTTNDTVMVWAQKRRGRIPCAINRLMNPKESKD